MNAKVGMTLTGTTIQGDLIEGEVLTIYQRTLVLLSTKDSLRYLVKLVDIDTSSSSEGGQC